MLNYLLRLAASFAAGYWLTIKAAPILQAKFEAMDLDTLWEIWNEDDEEAWPDE